MEESKPIWISYSGTGEKHEIGRAFCYNDAVGIVRKWLEKWGNPPVPTIIWWGERITEGRIHEV